MDNERQLKYTEQAQVKHIFFGLVGFFRMRKNKNEFQSDLINIIIKM